MKARPRDLDRLSRIKGQFIDLFDEMDIWLDETHEDTFCVELFNFSFRAAEFAAVLGFDRPPCEHIPLVAGHHRRFSDIRDEAVNTKICVYPPVGMQSFSFGFEGPLGEALMAEANARLHAELRAWVRQWKRAVGRVDVAAVRPALTTIVDYTNSHEATLFDEQRLREIAGDPTSFSDEIQADMAEVMSPAKLRGLAPAEYQSLIAERATALCNEAERRRQELGESEETMKDVEREFTDGPSLRGPVEPAEFDGLCADSSISDPNTEWSQPMTKAEMARRITGDPGARSRKVALLLKRYELDHVGGHTYRIRLDKMDPATRRKIEKTS